MKGLCEGHTARLVAEGLSSGNAVSCCRGFGSHTLILLWICYLIGSLGRAIFTCETFRPGLCFPGLLVIIPYLSILSQHHLVSYGWLEHQDRVPDSTWPGSLQDL